jgi:hypothetical protein
MAGRPEGRRPVRAARIADLAAGGSARVARLYGTGYGGLKEVYEESAAFSRYCTAVATDTRVLVVPRTGELVLLDATAKEYTELGRLAVFGKDEKGVYAHPAFVGTRLYLRGSGSVVCVELGK